MRITFGIILLALVGLCCLPDACFSAVDHFFHGVVIKVIDGDSIIIDVKNKRKMVRLWGIDSPERGMKYAEAAKRFVEHNVLGKSVKVRPYYKDEYGRVVADIFVNENNIAEAILENGFAWVHIYYCKKEICRKWRNIQENACRNKRGLWLDPSPRPPWEYKHVRKKQK